MEEIKRKLKEVLVMALRLKVPPADIGDKGLVASLGIDSINLLEILIYVEDEFKIKIEDEDLSPVLVDDIDRLVGYITARSGRSI